MAETEGFEPSIRLTTYDDLANRCLQPLGHISGSATAFAVNSPGWQGQDWNGSKAD
jgi:hypothetical protein